ncbi:type II secretion system protein GspM [Stenotrophomonas humi]
MNAVTTSNAVQRTWQQATTRWQALPPRDRLALQTMAVFFLALGFWFGVWTPVRAALQAAQANVAAEQQLQAHLRANASRLAGRGQVAAQMNAADVPALLASSAGKHGLSIDPLQPQPDKRIAVTLSGHPSAVVAWLEELQNAGVGMVELTLAQGEDGSWKSDVLLSGPGN